MTEIVPQTIRLFLISRRVREDLPPSRRTTNRYTYHLHRVGIDQELREFLLKGLEDQLRRLPAAEMTGYQPLDDDEKRTHVYDATDKSFAFMNVVRLQINPGPPIPPVLDLKDLGGALWASCYSLDLRDGRRLLGLRRSSASRIAIDRVDQSGLVRKALAIFDTNDTRLEMLRGDALTLENSLHAIFLDDRFYIFNKPSFETMVGIEEEYLNLANGMLSTLAGSELVVGLDIAKKEMEKSPRRLKRLANVLANPFGAHIDLPRLSRMRSLAGDWELNLKIADGKIVIEDSKDVDLLVQFLNDYFLVSPQTDQRYGSYAKRPLNRRR